MHVATKYSRRIIGMMSGTSLDAIDVAMVRIQKHGLNAVVKLVHFRSYPYPPKIRSVVRDFFDPKKARVDDICRYDFILGEVFAASILRLLEETKIKADTVDLVASAGQTVWHDPELVLIEPDVDWLDHAIQTRSTFAIGQSAVIAERTGIITVGDLRVRDVAAGGTPAPLHHSSTSRNVCRSRSDRASSAPTFFFAITVASFTFPSASRMACTAIGRVTPAASSTMRTARLRSFSFVAGMSIIKFE